uniref:Glycoprotein n=1 Tax=Strongyloides papillosus TaxID=174720 RepID=A0A0N5BM89_STREA
MEIFHFVFYFSYIGFILSFIPSKIPDCSLESPNIEYIYTDKFNDYIYLNQTWEVKIGERYFFKDHECLSTKHYVLVSKFFIIDLYSFEIWLKTKSVGGELCGYMSIKVHDGSYFSFYSITQGTINDVYESLKIDKKYDEAIKSFVIGTNFKNFIRREGKLKREEWLSLLNYLNIYYKSEIYNGNGTIYCYKKEKEHCFLKDTLIEYTPSWFSKMYIDLFGYEYYIYGEPEELLDLVARQINQIGNEIFKQNNYTLNKDIGEYIIDENDNNKKYFQVNEKIIVDPIFNGFKVKNCTLVYIKQVMNKLNKCGEKLMVNTNYGVRFYDVNLQTLILPEDLEHCDNKLEYMSLKKNDITNLEDISIFDQVKFQIANMNTLTIISFILFIILFLIFVSIILIIKRKYSFDQKKKLSFNITLEDDVIIEDYPNKAVKISKEILV